jgi:peptidoglycan/LPS O-acetylase OafA/YrhL
LREAGLADGRSQTCRRLPYLDSLRGLAALYVLIFHLSRIPTFRPVPPAWLTTFVGFGGGGVTLFFVASAFSLVLTMPRHIQTGRPLTSFYLSRFFRIAPLFYVLIVATYLRNVLVYGKWETATTVLASVGMVYNLIPGYWSGFVMASWTIGVEVLFYVVFPPLYFGLQTPAARTSALFAMCLFGLALPQISAELFPGLPTLADEFSTYFFLRNLPIFIIGMLAFDAHQWLAAKNISSSSGSALFLFGILGIAFIITNHSYLIFPFDLFNSVAVCFSCVLLGVAFCPLRAVVNRFTVAIGKSSYSIYLLHAPTIIFMSPVYKAIYLVPMPATASFLACFFASWRLLSQSRSSHTALSSCLVSAWGKC